MTHFNSGKTNSCGSCRKEESMLQPFDYGDRDVTDLHSGPAGEPDMEDADSMACWFGGLLEDPLDDRDSSEEDDCIWDESILYPSSEECEEPTSRTMEGCDER